MKCAKCGAELREEQKVCIQCGARTAAGGHFEVEQKQAWKPSANVKYAAPAAVLVLAIVVAAMCLRTAPPETVAKQWFDAMVSRNYVKAERFHSQRFIQHMEQTMSDTRAVSDMIIDRIGGPQTPYTFSPPTTIAPNQASVAVNYTAPDGQSGTITINLAMSGRRWLVTGVAY